MKLIVQLHLVPWALDNVSLLHEDGGADHLGLAVCSTTPFSLNSRFRITFKKLRKTHRLQDIRQKTVTSN